MAKHKRSQRTAPCGSARLGHRIGHRLGIQMQTECWRNIGELSGEGFAESFTQRLEKLRRKEGVKMTESEQADLFHDKWVASQRELIEAQAEKADASRKLRTVYDILAVLEREGATEVSTELIQALLQPTKLALGEAELITKVNPKEDENYGGQANE